MKRKGFTLVELLVVIAIIALLMGILMPALARVRQVAYRMMCGTNLAGIGKAMLLYAQENEEDYPVAGYLYNTKWTNQGVLQRWDHFQPMRVFGAHNSEATITSSFYYLVKYAEVPPKQFNCKGDISSRIFKLSDTPSILLDITLPWDFGGGVGCPRPAFYCSYSYHMPYTFVNLGGKSVSNPLNASSNSACPLAADRNPYLDRNAEDYIDGADPDEEPPHWDTQLEVYVDRFKTGNAAPHQREGQNVLYNDAHVRFEKYPNRGIEDDNIWKCWEDLQPDNIHKQLGRVPYDIAPGDPSFGPQEIKDSFLVSEDNRGDIE